MILLSASSLSDALDSIAIVNRVSARDAMLIGNVQRGLTTSRRAERALTAEQGRLTAASAAADAEAARAAAARNAKAALLVEPAQLEADRRSPADADRGGGGRGAREGSRDRGHRR